METVVVTGSVNDQHVLSANVPTSLPPGPVTIVVLPSSPEANLDREWIEGVAHEWADELSDPRQDIYTMDDGVSVNAT